MSIHLTLRYDDPRAALDFLTGTLGLVPGTVATADDGSVGHAELFWGDTAVMIGPRSGDPRFDTGRAVVYLVTETPDALHDKTSGAGARVVMEPVDQDYGSREFAVEDPEGNVWCFGTYRPSPPAADAP
ncbi:VOC family protein [Pseudonocardia pini]|uniref:VOC family protein n=1 Tax=Pseudonocardia pini TaxID=2758030 RepID=UPI0015F0CE66|nr:VOC family protein [Pseudonocardia pini]